MQWRWRGPDFSCEFAKLHFYGYFPDCAIPHLKKWYWKIWLRLNKNASEESERVSSSILHCNILICTILAVYVEVVVKCCMLWILQNCKTIASYCTVAADGKWSHLDFLTLSSAMQGEFCTATSSRQVVEIPNWWSVDVAKRLVTSQLNPPPPLLLLCRMGLKHIIHNLYTMHTMKGFEVSFIAPPPFCWITPYNNPSPLVWQQAKWTQQINLHKCTVTISEQP